MRSNFPLPPLSLYVHIPWCVRKCPYCDFNSHVKPQHLPVEEYTKALLDDLSQDSHFAQGRKVHSIFFGGGTPSLFPPEAIEQVLVEVDKQIGINTNAEITLEANPGTAEYFDFEMIRSAGVNRVSLGVQSFNDEHLSSLGRIHNNEQVHTAYKKARQAGFDNINLDLMHGLPNQSLKEGIDDLRQAIALRPEHISWYQLTIEPNTEFYSRPPTLPKEDTLVDILEKGNELLSQGGYHQYEISAYSQKGKTSQHNINYWQFGDYIGIGAGAHGKTSQVVSPEIIRTQKTRLPKDYMQPNKPFSTSTLAISQSQLPLEFMMNALRLRKGVPLSLWEDLTRMPLSAIEEDIKRLQKKGLLAIIRTESGLDHLTTTELGKRFLNDILEEFVNTQDVTDQSRITEQEKGYLIAKSHN